MKYGDQILFFCFRTRGAGTTAGFGFVGSIIGPYLMILVSICVNKAIIYC